MKDANDIEIRIIKSKDMRFKNLNFYARTNK